MSGQTRAYGGVDGDERRARRRERLIEAGLDLLSSEQGEAALTVRSVCARSGLAARYFYESFGDRTELALAVYDHVVGEIATTTAAAVAAGPRDARARTRAGLANIVRVIVDDPRRGRLLFSTAFLSAPLARRRLESGQLFCGLLAGHTKAFFGVVGDGRLDLATQFAVGGLAQALTAWLHGHLELDPEPLVDHCTDLFVALMSQALVSREPPER
ncbi:TetR/AcrR family transcriptional regulator [Pseudonocardia eucalypti]|uniref:TetR/AcrR family transcriptional regulator n=1 Tax=Pseudonocardia eucalypti TaxID=648755 RepID=A0ABP9QSD2_9PSEU|nr:AcrR family transcriptional regulator [Pseudonocardia eucalypti]